MSYEEMSWIEYTVNIIRDFIGKLSASQKDMILDILIHELQKIKGGYGAHG